MDPNQPTDPNQPQPQPGAASVPSAPQPMDLPQAPISADLPPTPTPPEPMPPPAAAPAPAWDAPASPPPAAPLDLPPAPPPVQAPAEPVAVPASDLPQEAPSNPWNQAPTPAASDPGLSAPVTDPMAPPAVDPGVPPVPDAPLPEAPPADQAQPQVANDWSQPVAPQPVSWETQPQAAPVDPAAPEAPIAPISQETAPTDLSSLAAALGAPNINGTPAEGSAVPMDQPMGSPTQVPQTPAAADAPTVVTGSHGVHLPKWVIIIVAVVGLLAVLGSSAYFILGIGQPAEPASTIPAEQQNLTNPPRSVIPTPTPVIQNDATSLGSISGASPSAQATPSGQIAPGASSVFDRRTTQ
jgi:hypothetical protein